MTDKEWLTCNDITVLLDTLLPLVPERKLRLFAFACCRHLELSPMGDQVLARLEEYAEGQGTIEELRSTRAAINDADREDWSAHDRHLLLEATEPRISYAVHSTAYEARLVAGGEWERSAQVELIRCLFSNSFRRVTLAPAWRTSTVTGLAHAIYTDRAFDRMPILGDALEDAGCTDASVLAHCRQLGPHVRGCWVVDLILGKE